ncbi:chemotaxis protein CheW [Gemmata sp. G18]|uniref:Chemotaxis protein CheW n=1 Tax=Gemmata palustris TaxID=2822762 RepID=A0ABS5BLJ5_9BACT|nr:chemotaxis protein CheW [Gemmata palustris]MBP3954566.1 chemotaxis protein CheW [Gemmata palustris]
MLGLVFQVGPDKVVVDVRRVREVVPRVQLTAVHGAPPWIAGVFVYRGRVVPVVDLHALAGVGECPQHLSSRIILFPYPLGIPEALVGVLATQVAEVREIRPAVTQPIPGPPGRPSLGPALVDGSGILRLLDPDWLLAQIAPGSGGLIGAGLES